MSTLLIKNATVVNEGTQIRQDVWIKKGVIHRISTEINQITDHVIDGEGLYLLPGVIDDQVHFREPGLTHKAEIATESRAAIAGGVTTFMEMPNTSPPTITQELLEAKYQRAAKVSPANYSFFMGASNDNLEEVLKTDPEWVCGVKVFMGSSTGSMLVDNPVTLEQLFSEVAMLIATHCEKEEIIQSNLEEYKAKFGEEIPVYLHPQIRSEEACYASSSQAVALARQYNTRLHILHISTEKELSLFRNDIPLEAKRITSEACIHHLWFTEDDYMSKGNLIKWNPAIKKRTDREALRKALQEDLLDIVATDHAPHTLEEKSRPYVNAPSGGPLIQHTLVAMLELVHQGIFTLELVVNKMCHAPAKCFQIDKRGFLREGYHADLVLVDLNHPWTISPKNLYYKCGWSPFEGTTFQSMIHTTIVNGNIVYQKGTFDNNQRGQKIRFNRS